MCLCSKGAAAGGHHPHCRVAGEDGLAGELRAEHLPQDTPNCWLLRVQSRRLAPVLPSFCAAQVLSSCEQLSLSGACVAEGGDGGACAGGHPPVQALHHGCCALRCLLHSPVVPEAELSCCLAIDGEVDLSCPYAAVPAPRIRAPDQSLLSGCDAPPSGRPLSHAAAPDRQLCAALLQG